MADKDKILADYNAEINEVINYDIRAILEKHGLSLDLAACKIKEQLNAKEIKAYNHNGEIIYSKPLRAWGVQQKATDMLLQLHNAFPDKNIKLEHSGTLNITDLNETVRAFKAKRDAA